MPTDVFTNTISAQIVLGGTDAPAQGTVESWTSATLPADFPVITAGQQLRVVDIADQNTLAGNTAWPEVMLVTAMTGGGGVEWTVTRGIEGTTPVVHLPGFRVVPILTPTGLLSWLPMNYGPSQVGALAIADNLSDVASPAAALANLGGAAISAVGPSFAVRGMPDYEILEAGGAFYAIQNSTGAVAYEGADVTVVTQDVLTALGTAGGWLHFDVGSINWGNSGTAVIPAIPPGIGGWGTTPTGRLRIDAAPGTTFHLTSYAPQMFRFTAPTGSGAATTYQTFQHIDIDSIMVDAGGSAAQTIHGNQDLLIGTKPGNGGSTYMRMSFYDIHITRCRGWNAPTDPTNYIVRSWCDFSIYAYNATDMVPTTDPGPFAGQPLTVKDVWQEDCEFYGGNGGALEINGVGTTQSGASIIGLQQGAFPALYPAGAPRWPGGYNPYWLDNIHQHRVRHEMTVGGIPSAIGGQIAQRRGYLLPQRTIATGGCTNGQPTVTDSSWSAADVGRGITAPGFAPGTTVLSVSAGVSGTLSNNYTGTTGNQAVQIGYNTTDTTFQLDSVAVYPTLVGGYTFTLTVRSAGTQSGTNLPQTESVTVTALTYGSQAITVTRSGSPIAHAPGDTGETAAWGSNSQIGGPNQGGFLHVDDCDFIGSGDVTLECDGWDRALIENLRCGEGQGSGIYHTNYCQPRYPARQRIDYNHCRAQRLAANMGRGFSWDQNGHSIPLGAVTLTDCHGYHNPSSGAASPALPYSAQGYTTCHAGGWGGANNIAGQGNDNANSTISGDLVNELFHYCPSYVGRTDAGCGVTNGSPTVTDTATTGFEAGAVVSGGVGFAAGTVVTNPVAGVGWTASNNYTGTTGTESITVSPTQPNGELTLENCSAIVEGVTVSLLWNATENLVNIQYGSARRVKIKGLKLGYSATVAAGSAGLLSVHGTELAGYAGPVSPNVPAKVGTFLEIEDIDFDIETPTLTSSIGWLTGVHENGQYSGGTSYLDGWVKGVRVTGTGGGNNNAVAVQVEGYSPAVSFTVGRMKVDLTQPAVALVNNYYSVTSAGLAGTGGWLSVVPWNGTQVVTPASATTTNLLPGSSIVEVSCVNGAQTVNLEYQNLCYGQTVTIKKIDSTANAVTVTASSPLDDGNQVLAAQFASATFYSDGAKWQVLSGGATATGVQGVALTAAIATLLSQINNGTVRNTSTLPVAVGAGECTVLTGSSAGTLTLPTSPTASTVNAIYNDSTAAVVLAAGGANTITAPGSTTLYPGASVIMQFIGTTWYVVYRSAVQVAITATNATWPIQIGAPTLTITAVGGGGGGGGGGSSQVTTPVAQMGGSAGSAGGTSIQTAAVGANTTLNVAIGAGGANVTSGAGAGAGGAAGSGATGNAGTNGAGGSATTVTGTGISVKAFGGVQGQGSAASSTATVPGGVYGGTGFSSPVHAGDGGASGSTGGSPVNANAGGGGGGGAATTGAGALGGSGGAPGTMIAAGAVGTAGGSGTVAGTSGAAATANTGGGGGGGGGGACTSGGTAGAGGYGMSGASGLVTVSG